MSGTAVFIGSLQDDESDVFDDVDRVLGAIIGAFIRTEQWDPVAPADVQWGLGPVAGGAVGVTVSLRF